MNRVNDRLRREGARPTVDRPHINVQFEGGARPAPGSDAEKVMHALGLLTITGHVSSELTKAGTPRHLVPREDVRRIKTARELHEAADRAAEGIPMPGTLAEAKVQAAEEAGDFTEARRLREEIKAFAPKIRAAARAKEAEDVRVKESSVREAVVNLSAMERAQLKRARRAARHLREGQ